MFERAGSIRGRVTVKCHARRSGDIIFSRPLSAWKQRRDNRFEPISDWYEKLSRNRT